MLKKGQTLSVDNLNSAYMSKINDNSVAGDFSANFGTITGNKLKSLTDVDVTNSIIFGGSSTFYLKKSDSTTTSLGGTNVRIESAAAGNVYLRSNGADQLILYSNGTIGMGTTAAPDYTKYKAALNGNALISGTIYLNDNTLSIAEGSGTNIKIQTPSGYMEMGPVNSSYCHIFTDRGSFYYNKRLTVDEGILSSYDENLALQTSGTTRMTILNSNGNVGIGTASPTANLEINGSSGQYGAIINSGGLGALRWGSGAQGYLSYGTGKVLIGGLASNELDLTANGDTKVKILTDGKVGIGTTAPSETLEVNGNIKGIDISSTGKVKINTSGDPTIGGATMANGWLQIGNGLSLDPNEICFNSASYIGVTGDYDLNFRKNVVNLLTIASSGNIGIGNSAPAYKLDVSGNINSTGTISAANATITGAISYTDVTGYLINFSSATNYGIYWDTTNNYMQLNGSGTDRFHVSLDTGNTYIAGAVDCRSSCSIDGPLNIIAGNGNGIRFWDSSLYSIYMSTTADATYGGTVAGAATSDYNMYFTMSSGTNRGWVFKNGEAKLQIDSSGNLFTAGIVNSAGYNDYAEYRLSKEKLSGGIVATESQDGYICRSNKRLGKACMITSDTYGFVMGEKAKNKDEYSIPIAVAGRVLVYTDKDRSSFKVGDVVCSGIDGTVSKMKWWEKILFPDRILGVVSEIPIYDKWGSDNVEVNNRIWIRVH